jgi:hypothetical protein
MVRLTLRVSKYVYPTRENIALRGSFGPVKIGLDDEVSDHIAGRREVCPKR